MSDQPTDRSDVTLAPAMRLRYARWLRMAAGAVENRRGDGAPGDVLDRHVTIDPETARAVADLLDPPADPGA